MSIAGKIGAPQARVATDVVHSGNTSAASIPLALMAMIGRGELFGSAARRSRGRLLPQAQVDRA